jgi:hypothetical protein
VVFIVVSWIGRKQSRLACSEQHTWLRHGAEGCAPSYHCAALSDRCCTGKSHYSAVATMCTTCFNISKRPHFAHTMYLRSMCSVWFSQQTATTSLNSINRLVVVMETQCSLRGTISYVKIYLDELRTSELQGRHIISDGLVKITSQAGWIKFYLHESHG